MPRSEMPLRRSAVGSHRESMSTTMVNDDEAERREARRRTLLQEARPRESSALESIEENETIRKCLEMYNGNKLSRDNAWSLSLIDTLSNLLDRHHKTLSNFKVSGVRSKVGESSSYLFYYFVFRWLAHLWKHLQRCMACAWIPYTWMQCACRLALVHAPSLKNS